MLACVTIGVSPGIFPLQGASVTPKKLLKRDANDPTNLIQFEEIHSADAVLPLRYDSLIQSKRVSHLLLTKSGILAGVAQQKQERLLLSPATA